MQRSQSRNGGARFGNYPRRPVSKTAQLLRRQGASCVRHKAAQRPVSILEFDAGAPVTSTCLCDDVYCLSDENGTFSAGLRRSLPPTPSAVGCNRRVSAQLINRRYHQLATVIVILILNTNWSVYHIAASRHGIENDHWPRTSSTDRLSDRRRPYLDHAAAAQLYRGDFFNRLGDFWGSGCLNDPNEKGGLQGRLSRLSLRLS